MDTHRCIHWVHLHMALRTKDAGLRLRVEKELRQEFVEACRASGKPAAQVLRDFMREFVIRERVATQGTLFGEASVDSGPRRTTL
jgi:hypothetical protein